MSGQATGHLERCFRRWAMRYRSFAQRRFARLSRGGGEWAPLKPATIRRRRTGRGEYHLGRTRGAALQKLKRMARGAEGDDGKTIRIQKRIAAVLGNVAILRDTGALFAALQPTLDTSTAAIEEIVQRGIRVGYGGPHRHPKGKATIADIAAFHDTGAGRLPKRQIIVDPDAATQRGMATDLENAIDAISGEVGAR